MKITKDFIENVKLNLSKDMNSYIISYSYLIELLEDYHVVRLNEKTKCHNCGEMVNMVSHSEGKFCPKCFC